MNAILLQCCSSAAKAMKCGCETTLSTSKNDIAIAAIICGTFVIIALIVALSVWAWKNKEIKSKEKERKDEEKKTQEESIRKQKADLLVKKLEILHELCYTINEDKNKKSLKQLNSDEVMNYVDAIDQALRIISSEPYMTESQKRNHK